MLRIGEAQHKVLRKALNVALRRLIEPPGAHAIDRSQIAIENHSTATD
jgi:hypothetical protein